jgi:hypothetical protein
LRGEHVANAGQGDFEILLNIVRQRLQGRDIDDLRLVLELPVETLPDQPVDRGEKSGERLARTGRGGDEDGLALLNRRPRLGLRRGRGREPAGEPGRDGGMESGDRDAEPRALSLGPA